MGRRGRCPGAQRGDPVPIGDGVFFWQFRKSGSQGKRGSEELPRPPPRTCPPQLPWRGLDRGVGKKKSNTIPLLPAFKELLSYCSRPGTVPAATVTSTSLGSSRVLAFLWPRSHKPRLDLVIGSSWLCGASSDPSLKVGSPTSPQNEPAFQLQLHSPPAHLQGSKTSGLWVFTVLPLPRLRQEVPQTCHLAMWGCCRKVSL